MMTTMIVKGVERGAVAKSTVHEKMAMLDVPSLMTSMTAITERWKVIDLKPIAQMVIAQMVMGVRRALVSISRSQIIRDHLTSHNMENSLHLRMDPRRRVDFIRR